jgi:hypothetical protein
MSTSNSNPIIPNNANVQQTVDPFAPDATQVGMGYGTPAAGSTGTGNTPAGGAAADVKKGGKGGTTISGGASADLTVDNSTDPYDTGSTLFNPDIYQKDADKEQQAKSGTVQATPEQQATHARHSRRHLNDVTKAGGIA